MKIKHSRSLAGNSVFCEARRRIENILEQTNADPRQDVAAGANPGLRQPPPKKVGGKDSGIPPLYMKRVYGCEFKSEVRPRAGDLPGSQQQPLLQEN
jgi:hypothetical protein